jgi:hypothetical protein
MFVPMVEKNITVTIYGIFIIHGTCKTEINDTTLDEIRADWSKFTLSDIGQYRRLRNKWFE